MSKQETVSVTAASKSNVQDIGRKRANKNGSIQKDVVSKKRKSSYFDNETVKKQLEGDCGCTLKCYKKFEMDDIMFWRYKIHRLKGKEKMESLMDTIRLTATDLRKFEKYQLFRINQKLICRKTLIFLILNISVPTFTRAKRAVMERRTRTSARPKKLTHAWRGKVCEGFIRSYINSVCDNDPARCRYRMPLGLTRIKLFYMYKTVHEKDGLEKSAFFAILKKKFPELSFNKTQRFTKCRECNDLCELIEKETNPHKLLELEDMLQFHHRLQQLEREAYYVRCGLAEMRPSEYMSIILDGMDQNKTDLPHFVKWNNPNGSGTFKLRTHITGSIVHGRGKHCFVDYNQFQHNTNLTLTCLLRILKKEALRNQLPPTLFIQLDNTCRENKNKYFLGMMAYLVKKKIVREVWMSFLIVGHTHEDVDQSFSKISHQLKISDAITLPELHEVIRKSQTPSPSTENIHAVWDISTWLTDYINPVHNVTFPKLYRIFNDGAGHTTIKFKVLSSDDEWHPTTTERPLEIFRIENNEQKIPPSVPEIVQQCMQDDDLADLKRSIVKDYKLAKFTEEREKWWNEFLQDPYPHPSLNETTWPLEQFTTYNIPDPASSSLGEKERGLIQKYLEKRTEFKEVYTSQRGSNADRRCYSVGEVAVFLRSDMSAEIGRILKCNKDQMEMEMLKKKQGKYEPSGILENADVTKCLPGSFKLTNGGNIPQAIKNRINSLGYTLV